MILAGLLEAAPYLPIGGIVFTEVIIFLHLLDCSWQIPATTIATNLRELFKHDVCFPS